MGIQIVCSLVVFLLALSALAFIRTKINSKIAEGTNLEKINKMTDVFFIITGITIVVAIVLVLLGLLFDTTNAFAFYGLSLASAVAASLLLGGWIETTPKQLTGHNRETH